MLLIWPSILKTMSFNGVRSNGIWKGGGWRNTGRYHNLGKRLFICESYFGKVHLEHQWSNVPIQGLKVRLKKSIRTCLTQKRGQQYGT